MNRKDSITYCSGQAWKLNVLYLGAPLAALLMAWSVSLEGAMPDGYHMLLMLLSTMLAFVVIMFPCLSIKCPVCGARWLWLAISEKHEPGDFKWLLTRLACPVCHSSCRKLVEKKNTSCIEGLERRPQTRTPRNLLYISETQRAKPRNVSESPPSPWKGA